MDFVVYLREFISLMERFTEYSNTAFKDKVRMPDQFMEFFF